jgi:hypothetical protein
MRATAFTIASITAAMIAAVPAQAARAKAAATTAYDGPWHLSFVTQRGPCDPSYEFDVNIRRGQISHPNLVRFKGRVSRGGSAHASVIVGDKSASGYGRLSRESGSGRWSGFSGGSRCAGMWTARRS